MPRNITISFEDGTSHVYQNAPDDVSPDQVEARASKEFGKKVTALDGGRGAPEAAKPTDEPFAAKLGRQVIGLGAGLGAGFGKVAMGAQELAGRGLSAVGVDKAGDWLQKDAVAGRSKLTGELAPYKEATPFAAGLGEVAGEVIPTLPVGGAIAGGLSKLPAVAAAVPNLLSAIRTGGMTAGTGGNAIANLATRSVGGAITGGASAALVDPNSAGTGAVIGGALPGGIKLAGLVGQGVGNVVSAGTKNVLGFSTGVGAEPISQAFKAGKTGNAEFMANMRGDVPLTDVLDRAKQGLAAMGAEKSAQYRSGMIPIQGDKTVLSLSNLDQALTDASAITSFKGQVKNDSAASAVGKMRQIVDEWKALAPAQFHTPEGLDALKQKLGGILEGIPFQERTARLAAGKVYTAAKDTIDSQAPAYAKVMKDYSEASAQITEIERALSLGDKASKDTAMRKLQSLMRNNVQTNYGNRLNLANSLEQGGGVELMPSLAGQALNSFTPRSLSGQIGGGATALASMMTGNPAGLALLPFQSPRIVGTMAYGAGKLSGAASRATNAIQQAANPALASGAAPNALQQLRGQLDLTQLGYRAAPVLAVGR